MSRNRPQIHPDPFRAVKKLFLSGFVVVAFIAYVVHERLTRLDFAPASTAATVVAAPATLMPFISATGATPPAFSSQPTSSGPAGEYKNGTYAGEVVDAYYGLVQVQVSIRAGAINDVEFLQYPNDRRTSVQINSIAMPYLKEEAIQAQSARVDIISGATLTSEGFQMSLQSALQAAHN